MQRSAPSSWLGLLLACALPALALAAGPDEPKPKPATAELEGVTATILDVKPDKLLVVRTGSATDRDVPRVLEFTGGADVPVSGGGKSVWDDLEQGDPVLVTYQEGEDGDQPKVRKINVLTRDLPVDPLILAQAGIPLEKPAKRTFVGYIKKKEGDVLHVMRPRGAPPVDRPAQIKRFVRQEGTVVAVLRDGWDELKKGDRVRIEFEKGNPRPADLVQVIWRGGEKPLPPGVATRLFDPTYDDSVKDVDGIGETQPLPPGLRRGGPHRKVQIKLPRT